MCIFEEEEKEEKDRHVSDKPGVAGATKQLVVVFLLFSLSSQPPAIKERFKKNVDRLYIHVVVRLVVWDAGNNKFIIASSHSQSF